jgi:hypothetical protein
MLRILAVPLMVSDNGTVRTPGNVYVTSETFLRHVYPIGLNGIEWVVRGEPLDVTMLDLRRSNRDRNLLLARLSVLQVPLCRIPPIDLEPCYDKIVGFLPPMTDLSLGWAPPGLEDGPVVVMADGRMDPSNDSSTEVTTMRWILAHEVGHTFGLGEEYDGADAYYECDINPPPNEYHGNGDPTSCLDSPEDPWPPAWGNSTSTTGSWIKSAAVHPFEVIATVPGFDPLGALGDKVGFMGSGTVQRNAWVTQREYAHLFSHPQLTPVTASGMHVDSAVQVAAVSGWVSKDNHGFLRPTYVLPGIPPSTQSGDYQIESVDASDNVLASQGFDVSYVLPTHPPETLDRAIFETAVGLPVGTVKLRVRHGGTVLVDQEVSPNPPSVTVTGPSAGTLVSGKQTITWHSGDADGNDLYHVVEYSPDGQDWIVLDADVRGTRLLTDFDLLPGGSGARVRITVTDGVNTSQAVGGVFSVAQKVSGSEIKSPKSSG